MDFNATQVLDDPVVHSDDTGLEPQKTHVGLLTRLTYKGSPQVRYPIVNGENVIGRSLGECHIHIPMKAISTRHAVIEVEGDTHLIYDLESRNKTWKSKLVLKPHVRYELREGDTLRFADVVCKYSKQFTDASSSETESEPTASLESLKDPTGLGRVGDRSSDGSSNLECPTVGCPRPSISTLPETEGNPAIPGTSALPAPVASPMVSVASVLPATSPLPAPSPLPAESDVSAVFDESANKSDGDMVSAVPVTPGNNTLDHLQSDSDSSDVDFWTSSARNGDVAEGITVLETPAANCIQRRLVFQVNTSTPKALPICISDSDTDIDEQDEVSFLAPTVKDSGSHGNTNNQPSDKKVAMSKDVISDSDFILDNGTLKGKVDDMVSIFEAPTQLYGETLMDDDDDADLFDAPTQLYEDSDPYINRIIKILARHRYGRYQSTMLSSFRCLGTLPNLTSKANKSHNGNHHQLVDECEVGADVSNLQISENDNLPPAQNELSDSSQEEKSVRENAEVCVLADSSHLSNAGTGQFVFTEQVAANDAGNGGTDPGSSGVKLALETKDDAIAHGASSAPTQAVVPSDDSDVESRRSTKPLENFPASTQKILDDFCNAPTQLIVPPPEKNDSCADNDDLAHERETSHSSDEICNAATQLYVPPSKKENPQKLRILSTSSEGEDACNAPTQPYLPPAKNKPLQRTRIPSTSSDDLFNSATQPYIPPAKDNRASSAHNDDDICNAETQLYVPPDKKNQANPALDDDDICLAQTQIYVPPSKKAQSPGSVADESRRLALAETVPMDDLPVQGQSLQCLAVSDFASSCTDEETVVLKKTIGDVLQSKSLLPTPERSTKMQSKGVPTKKTPKPKLNDGGLVAASTSAKSDIPRSKQAARKLLSPGSPVKEPLLRSPRKGTTLFPPLSPNAKLVQSPKTYSRQGKQSSPPEFSIENKSNESGEESPSSSPFIGSYLRKFKVTPKRYFECSSNDDSNIGSKRDEKGDGLIDESATEDQASKGRSVMEPIKASVVGHLQTIAEKAGRKSGRKNNGRDDVEVARNATPPTPSTSSKYVEAPKPTKAPVTSKTELKTEKGNRMLTSPAVQSKRPSRKLVAEEDDEEAVVHDSNLEPSTLAGKRLSLRKPRGKVGNPAAEPGTENKITKTAKATKVTRGGDKRSVASPTQDQEVIPALTTPRGTRRGKVESVLEETPTSPPTRRLLSSRKKLTNTEPDSSRDNSPAAVRIIGARKGPSNAQGSQDSSQDNSPAAVRTIGARKGPSNAQGSQDSSRDKSPAAIKTIGACKGPSNAQGSQDSSRDISPAAVRAIGARKGAVVEDLSVSEIASKSRTSQKGKAKLTKDTSGRVNSEEMSKELEATSLPSVANLVKGTETSNNLLKVKSRTSKVAKRFSSRKNVVTYSSEEEVEVKLDQEGPSKTSTTSLKVKTADASPEPVLPQRSSCRSSAMAGRKKVAEWTSRGKRKTTIGGDSADSTPSTLIESCSSVETNIDVDPEEVVSASDSDDDEEVTSITLQKIGRPSKSAASRIVETSSPTLAKVDRPSRRTSFKVTGDAGATPSKLARLARPSKIAVAKVPGESSTPPTPVKVGRRPSKIAVAKVPGESSTPPTPVKVGRLSRSKKEELTVPEVRSLTRSGKRKVIERGSSDEEQVTEEAPTHTAQLLPTPPYKRKRAAEQNRPSTSTASDLTDRVKQKTTTDKFSSPKDVTIGLSTPRKGKQKKVTAVSPGASNDEGDASVSPTPSKKFAAEATGKGSRQRRAGRSNADGETPTTPSMASTPSTLSPRGKRTATRTPTSPEPKKCLTDANLFASPLGSSGRISKPKVMFTGINDKRAMKIIKDVGGELVDSVSDCTHLVTDRIRRTCKLLCCISMGIPIVSIAWLENCKKAKSFIDPQPYLIQDPAMESQHGFSLVESLASAIKQPFLRGYKVHVTAKVLPKPEEMQPIIECAGGTFLPKMPTRMKIRENVVVLSCSGDLMLCSAALKASIPIVSSEFILTGALRQKADIESFLLDGNTASPAKTPTSPLPKDLKPTKARAGRPRTKK